MGLGEVIAKLAALAETLPEEAAGVIQSVIEILQNLFG